jgi:hypothetical protein
VSIPQVPCKDHTFAGGCHLDLIALRARTRAVLDLREKEKAKLRPLEKGSDRSVPPVREMDAMRHTIRTHTDELRRLYSCRAHHRGRVHESSHERYKKAGAGRGFYDPKAIEKKLLVQAAEVAGTWALFERKVAGPILEPFDGTKVTWKETG